MKAEIKIKLDRSQLTVLTEEPELVEKFEALMCEAGFHHRYP
jgi:23S rRNA A1618 N6-methylase RlmF